MTAPRKRCRMSSFALALRKIESPVRASAFLNWDWGSQRDEENVSTESAPTQEDARIPHPHAIESRSGRLGAPSTQRPSPTLCVTTPRRAQRFLPGERLRQGKDIRRAYQEGQRVVCRFFVAFVRPRSAGPLRLGVVASRRVGGAVARNRAKRLMREVFRLRKPGREVSADVVLVARGPIVKARYRDVETAFVRNVGKLLEKTP